MNENEINVLLDHFVGGLDSTESASVSQKINTLPLWSKTYKQVAHVFSSLNALKEQDSQQTAPAGLANKTFQKILEQQKTQQNAPEFIAQKSDESEQTVKTTHSKRSFSVKPSFLAISACTGFLLVFILASVTFQYRHPSSNPNTIIANDSANFNNSLNNPLDFAVTGSSQQPSAQLFSCSNSSSDASMAIPFANNCIVIDPSEQLVNLTPSAGSTIPDTIMACPDNFAVLASESDGRPIVLVQPYRLPDELKKKIQDVVNTQKVNIVKPVNYKK